MADRKPLDFTAHELAMTLFATFLLGGIASWGFFGQPRLADKIFETASIADWLAALGTWVIGYSAVRYARDAHALNVQKARQADKESKERAVSQHVDWTGRLISARVAHLTIVHASASAKSQPALFSADAMIKLMRSAMAVLPSTVLPTHAVLSIEHQGRFTTLNPAIEFQRTGIVGFIEAFGRESNRTKVMCDTFDDLCGGFKFIENRAQEALKITFDYEP